MTRRNLIGAIAPSLLMAQADKFPSRLFRYGEVLRGKNYKVVLQEFGFQVHSTNPDVDHVEIQVGRETTFLEDGKRVRAIRVLRFETFTSTCPANVAVALGELPDIDKVRTIRIVMLKVKGEEMFR